MSSSKYAGTAVSLVSAFMESQRSLMLFLKWRLTALSLNYKRVWMLGKISTYFELNVVFFLGPFFFIFDLKIDKKCG